jgi:hypothetical protein
MIDVALKLKTPRRAGIAIETIPDYYQNFTFYPFIWQGGGNVIDNAWKHAEIDSPAGAAALQLWGDLVHKYKVSPPKFRGAPHNSSFVRSGGQPPWPVCACMGTNLILVAHAAGARCRHGDDILRTLARVPAGEGVVSYPCTPS